MMPIATLDVGVPPIRSVVDPAAGLFSETGVAAGRGASSRCPGRSQVSGSSSRSVLVR
jgi:hypothetical protein